ncbi:MAG: acyl-CoA dehydrogenase C-terminal domain-containing protein, partial [Desulfobacula sp.]|nr:acyl-CoA dehydrogenase C-terminal domain-containing protein [Desulfobacula sp.]
KPLAAKFEKMVSRFEKVVKLMSRTPEHSSDILKARSLSGPFLHITGDVILAWMLLWRAHVAQKQLDKATPKKRKAFYQGQMESARFFIENIGPITMGRMDSIMDSGDAVLKISTDAFGGR